MPSTLITTHRRSSRAPVPAHRAARYARPASAGVLPAEQFFDLPIKFAVVCPETALMYAVLEDAFLCFHKQFEAPPQFTIERARESEDWFFSDDSCWLFSFLSICAALGLEPHDIRRRLKQWPAARLDIAPATR